jgi:hypothetical protein
MTQQYVCKIKARLYFKAVFFVAKEYVSEHQNYLTATDYFLIRLAFQMTVAKSTNKTLTCIDV